MRAKVLFAEDQASIRQLFTELLHREGLGVTSCGSAREACQQLADHRFDLVITDIRMETTRAGYDVVRTAQKLRPAPPVIILTAFPIAPADLRGLDIAAILMKGTDIRGLLNCIREIVKNVA